MGTDFWIVLQWWGTLFLIGAASFPLTKRLFSTWYDRGYFFSKAVGLAVVTYCVYLLAILHIAPFAQGTVYVVLATVFLGGIALQLKTKDGASEHKMWSRIIRRAPILLFEEVFFFVALLLWAWVKGHEPSIHGLEKFMDYGFMQSILNSSYFPAPDMWYVGFPINYYYFGHTVVAVLVKLSGIDLIYGFNLMLATIFALCLTMSFSLGYSLLAKTGKAKAFIGGLLSAFLVTLAGNMQTLYAFTKGYTGEDVKPFWHLLWRVGEFWGKLPEGLDRYWYANATRFIPFTIHEFPSYSFVVSDIHGHVLSIPFVLLAIALLLQMFGGRQERQRTERDMWLRVGFYGLLVSVLLMTNALDGPIYFGLFVLGFLISHASYLSTWKKHWRHLVFPIALMAVTAGLASLPFLTHFKSFVSGVAINCPPGLLANKTFGIVLFEGIEKCQHSPFWMMWLLWGFFWFCGGLFIWWKMGGKKGFSALKTSWSTKFTQSEQMLVVFFFFSIALIIFPEFIYFKDIYPAHFRSNTMFKLGYQAFIMFSLISGYVIVQMVSGLKGVYKKIFILLIIPQLFLVSIYPIFSVRSYFDSLRTYKGIDGLNWLRDAYPDDYEAILWLRGNAKGAVVLEADGDSYTDYARFSAFTGFPTVIGWPVHEWLWRGTYDVVAPRREDVRLMYESTDLEETQRLLTKYGVSYIVVGALEKEKYPLLEEGKFTILAHSVFTWGNTTIYEVDSSSK
jgi:YYY domain-containing protein